MYKRVYQIEINNIFRLLEGIQGKRLRGEKNEENQCWRFQGNQPLIICCFILSIVSCLYGCQERRGFSIWVGWVEERKPTILWWLYFVGLKSATQLEARLSGVAECA